MELVRGQSFGPYRLVEPAGRGGMAEVWRAHDARLNRQVAIKFLAPRYATDADYLERFRREAQAISRLDHPNILTVHDYGEQDGWTYMVSPYLGGGTLAARLRRGPWSLDEALSIIEPLALALDYAHSAGIVHRDVKPSNVLFTEHGRLVLTDFGIARILEGTTLMSQAGLIVGTPMYMSPEQADGAPAGPASDIYSLGVIAYEMLTGMPPFTGETPLALLRAHIDKPLPPPHTLNPNLPSDVEAALFTVLAKDPRHRFPSGREFVEILRRTRPLLPQPHPAPTPNPIPPPIPPRPDPPADPTRVMGRAGWRDVLTQWPGAVFTVSVTWAIAWILLILLRQASFEPVTNLYFRLAFFQVAEPAITIRTLVSALFGLIGGAGVAFALLQTRAVTGWRSLLWVVGGWTLSFALVHAAVYGVAHASGLANVRELDLFLGYAQRTSTSRYAALIGLLLDIVPVIIGGYVTASVLARATRRWSVRPLLGWSAAAALAFLAAGLGDVAARAYFGGGSISTPAGHGLVVGLLAGLAEGFLGGWIMLIGLPLARPTAPMPPGTPPSYPTTPLPPPGRGVMGR